MKISQEPKFNFLSPEEQERYQKHLTLKEIDFEGQLKLKNSSVLCVGAGGLGSSVMLYLAAAGIGKIGIIDNDIVERSNLQRQIIHNTNTVGDLKVDSAKNCINNLNPNIEVLTFREKLTTENALGIIKDFDVVCDCSDNFGTRYLINDATCILKKPLVFGSVQGFEGQISVFNLFKDSPNLRDLLPESPSKNNIPSCAEFGVVGVSTGLIGVLQVNEIIKIILRKGEILDGKLLIFNLLTLNIKKFTLKADKLNNSIKNLTEFEDFYEENQCSEKNNEIKKIKAYEFSNLYKKKLTNILLIDVRESEEFANSAIEGAISIPLSVLDNENHLEFIRKESSIKDIFTLCKFGKRSEKASNLLSKFKIQSTSIEGGIEKMKEIMKN